MDRNADTGLKYVLADSDNSSTGGIFSGLMTHVRGSIRFSLYALAPINYCSFAPLFNGFTYLQSIFFVSAGISSLSEGAHSLSNICPMNCNNNNITDEDKEIDKKEFGSLLSAVQPLSEEEEDDIDEVTYTTEWCSTPSGRKTLKEVSLDRLALQCSSEQSLSMHDSVN